MNCNVTKHLEQAQILDLLDELAELVAHSGFPQNIVDFLDKDLERARQAYSNPQILYPTYVGERFDSVYRSQHGREIHFTFNIEVLLKVIDDSNLMPVEQRLSDLLSNTNFFYDHDAKYIPDLAKSTVPIIALPFSGQIVVADGNKRLTARLKNGLTTIEVYWLGETEAMLALQSRGAQYLYRFLLNLSKFKAKFFNL